MLLTVDQNLSAKVLRNRETKNVRWDAYRKYLSQVSPPSDELTEIAEVDDAIDALTETIRAAHREVEVEVLPEIFHRFPDPTDLIQETMAALPTALP